MPAGEIFNGSKRSNVQSEPDGLVNISRFRAKTTRARADVAANQKNVAFAKAIIHTDRNQVRRMSFGYSDEVSIFLNGQILSSADSTFRSRDPGFLGIVGVDNDSVYLSLEKGENELVLAVRATFGGWGFICRLDDMTGVTSSRRCHTDKGLSSARDSSPVSSGEVPNLPTACLCGATLTPRAR